LVFLIAPSFLFFEIFDSLKNNKQFLPTGVSAFSCRSPNRHVLQGGNTLESFFSTTVEIDSFKNKKVMLFLQKRGYRSYYILLNQDEWKEGEKENIFTHISVDSLTFYHSSGYRLQPPPIIYRPAVNQANSPIPLPTISQIFMAVIAHQNTRPSVTATAMNIKAKIRPCAGEVLFIWSSPSFLFLLKNGVSEPPLGCFSTLINNLLKIQKIEERYLALRQNFCTLFFPNLFLFSLIERKKQKVTGLTPLFPLFNVLDRLSFLNEFKFLLLQKRILFFFIRLAVSCQKKWRIFPLMNLEDFCYSIFIGNILLPVTYFLTDKKYPQSFTTLPSSSVPLFHPSFSISFSGTTIVYLYFVIPLYSYAFALCIIIKNSIQLRVYKYGTIKFIYSCCILYTATDMKEVDVKEMINARKVRGMTILEEGIEPKEVNKSRWIVPSQSGNGAYTVRFFYTPNMKWTCTCPDYEHRGLPCKHINAVKIWKNIKDKFEQLNLKIKQNIKVDDFEIECCKFCHSTDFIKYGRKNGKQVYKCKSCNRKFVNNVDFENLKYNPKIVALTLDLYFRGLSLRKISSHLKEFYELSVSYMTIHRWIDKYIGIMNEYVNTIQPDIGKVWHADEMYVNIGGSWEYLWNVMDEKTRYQLCSVVSTERRVRDARIVFQKAKRNVGNRKPKFIITDGLHSYKRAINKEFLTTHGETEHLYNVGLHQHPNNNHVERLHGTIRNREKTLRGVKKEDSKIIEGHRLYYNFIKPHESLGGKTPSEEAGITIDGSNKWLTLMHNAIKYQKSKNTNIV
jgi:transposase-like protein